jgi:streptomycin 6-kinase
MFIAIPDQLAHIAASLGDVGIDWLAGLRDQITRCADRWSLTIGPTYLPGGATAFAARVTRANGTLAVLKLAIPDRETQYEADALRLYAGEGAVYLLAEDQASGALLLERCEPGTPLSTVDEVEAITIACGLLRRLWRTVPNDHPFNLAHDRAQEWSGTVWTEFLKLGKPFEPALAQEAATLFRDLTHSSEECVLLHQDFHHGNILAAERLPWLVIDPKPLVGERAFDTGALLRDRRRQLLASEHPQRQMARRLDQLEAELSLDRARMRAWGLAQAVELGLWSFSIGDLGAEREIECARLLARLKE